MSTFLLATYRVATTLAAPLLFRSVARKLRAADVPAERINERRGYATQPRPDGQLIWFHGASVGETLSVLTLIERLGDKLPQSHFLITSGTATSAELVGKRLPPRSRHQFAPLDSAATLRRFFNHWRPDAGIFVESELWPNTLRMGAARGVAMALLNARLSAKSLEGWEKFPDTSRAVLDCFRLILTQNRETAEGLARIGADRARLHPGANLKATSAPLPVDQTLLAQMQAATQGREIWIAASTHPGEEETVLAAQQALLAEHENALLWLVPRHPERADEVAALIRQTGLRFARRSQGALPEPGTQVYLADTLGELGTWYALSGMTFLGGSLLPIGGHNPFEPAQQGTAVLTGPHVANFSETFEPMIKRGAAQQISDAPSLQQALSTWMRNPGALERAQIEARDFASQQAARLTTVIETLCDGLDL